MPKPHRIASARHLDLAIAALSADARLKPLIARTGRPKHRPHRREGFEALAQIVVNQQLSAAAGDTIFSRLKAAVDPFTAANLLAADEKLLRSCGLSAPKQKHLRSIATAIADGSLDLERVRKMADQDARAHLTAVKGIGPWTADIYLMSCLGRADIWPVGDVALQAAIHRALKMRKRPNEKAMEKLSQSWKPWRTVAARVLWMHEDAIRQAKREAERAKAAAKKLARKAKKER